MNLQCEEWSLLKWNFCLWSNGALINSFTRKICVHQRKFCNMTNKFHYVNETWTPACMRACVNVCLLFLAAVGTGQAFTIWHSIYILKQEVLSAALWVRSNDPWLVRSFTTLYFNRSISIACAVKLRTHIRELNSICLLAKMCDNIGKWTELWFYAQHPHNVWPLFYALHRRTEKRKLNFYELDTRIGVKI